MKKLGIKTIVYFTPGKFEHLHEEFNCMFIEAKEKEHPDLDIEAPVEYILELMQKKEKTPILVFCLTGMISAAVCTRVMLQTNKAWSKEIALAYILNKRYECREMPSWLYSQINVGTVIKKSKQIEQN